MSEPRPPSIVERFAEAHPEVWKAYNALGDATARAGPLDERTARLVKLALAVGSGRQGAVGAHVRRGLAAGLTPAELRQVAILGITTLGWPQAFAAHCWIEEKLERAGG